MRDMISRLWVLLCIFVSAGYCADPQIDIVALSVLQDNYAYVIRWEDKAIVIDPGEGCPVASYIHVNKLKLVAILNTHHHWDHVDGNLGLKEWSQCRIYGPKDRRIPGLDQGLADGERIQFGPIEVIAIGTPGHTRSHQAFYIPKLKALFTGDCIFGAGCGYLFEGTPANLMTAFENILALPEETLLYYGHEYTLNNMRFAYEIDPENTAVTDRFIRVAKLRKEGLPSVPERLDVEKKTNPFMRYDDTGFRERLGIPETASHEAFFNEIVALKQRFNASQRGR